jgi:hypothetical protein
MKQIIAKNQVTSTLSILKMTLKNHNVMSLIESSRQMFEAF